MTREETIAILRTIQGDYIGGYISEALNLAIEALQENESLARSVNEASELLRKKQRPHGEWITVKREFDGVKGKFMAEYCACSNCGWDNEHWQTQWVACPKCGADMRKKGDRNEID